MTREQLGAFIGKTKNELLNISDDIIDDFTNPESDIPIFYNKKIDYKVLLESHFNINKNLALSKTILELEDESFDDIVFNLIKLKFICDSFIKSHNEYTSGKFKKQYEKILKIDSGHYFIDLEKPYMSKRLIFIKHSLKMLIEKERVENNSEQRISYISLFFPYKQRELFKWCNHIYDLKAFFDILEERGFIKKPPYFNDFVSETFIILNDSNVFQKFTSHSYKTSTSQVGYNKVYPEWEKAIDKISLLTK